MSAQKIDSYPTTEEQVEHLRHLLAGSYGHDHSVIRPSVPVGVDVDPVTGQKFTRFGPGPVTVVTFYIAHGPSGE